MNISMKRKKIYFAKTYFHFPHSLCRSLTNTIYSLSKTTLTELYHWDFGNLNNDIEKLEFPSGWNQQEKIQYAKDAYSSKSVNYVIEFLPGKIADTDTLWLSVKTSISSCFMTEKSKACAPIRANQRGFATVSDLLRRGLYPLHSRGRASL